MTQVPAAYQQEAILWLLEHKRGILADAPGVGKTLPAIEAALSFAPPRLVVTPAYLTTNWESYLEEQGEKSVSVVKGKPHEKVIALTARTNWTIISYDTLARQEYEAVASRLPWNMVICDEAHRLRGRNTVRAKMAYRLFRQIPVFWGLTGTPLVSNAGDIFPLLKICDPKTHGSYWSFVEEHARVEITPWAKIVHGPRNPKEFFEMLQPYMLRRTLEQVLPDVPDTIENIIRVDVAPATRTALKKAKEDYLIEHPDGLKTRIGAGGLVSAMRQLVNLDGAKQEALLGLLEDIPQDEPLVVFTWHKALADNAAFHLINAGRKVEVLTGALSAAARADAVTMFQQGRFDTIVATIASLQEGVNLQRACYAIFLESDWVAASNEQALARLHRRGQSRTVVKYTILARKTVDESVHRAAQKRATMNQIFDSLWEEA